MDERDFWDLKLLGDMGLRIGGRVLPKFPTKKVALLVAVVALEHPKPVSRDRLTSILWPDATQAQGRQNLRKALSMLRQTLGGDSAAVATDGDCVGLRAHITTDVQRLEQSISVSATPRGRADTLLLALTQYEPFLEGMYEDWVIEQRQRVQRLFVAASTEATSLFLEQKRPAEAVDAARRAAEVDDLSEVAHLSLIRALVADNRIAEAAAQAEALRRRFYDEFGEDMSAETRTAIRALLADARQRPELLMDKVKQERDPERAYACADLLDRAFDAWYGPEEAAWTARVAEIEPQIMEALQWCRTHDPALGVRIVGPLGRYWLGGRDFAKGKVALQAALSSAEGLKNEFVARAQVALFVLMLMSAVQDTEKMQRLLDEAEDLYRAAGNEWGIAHVTRNRGLLLNYLNRTQEARDTYLSAVRQFEEVRDPAGVALSLLCLGMVRANGNYGGGFPATAKAYRAFLEVGNTWGRKTAFDNVCSDIQHLCGADLHEALSILELELAHYTLKTDRPKLIWIHSRLALIHHMLNDLGMAFNATTRLTLHVNEDQRGMWVQACKFLRAQAQAGTLDGDFDFACLLELDEQHHLEYGSQRIAPLRDREEFLGLLRSVPSLY